MTTYAVGSVLALSAGGVELDFNRSVILQMAVFALLILILKPLLFDPMLRVFALREERTEGEKRNARELLEKAGELLKRYEAELERVNQAAAQERERIRAETARLEAEILREARDVTNRILEDGRRKIEAEVNRIRFDLGRESERLAHQIESQLLGREVS
jgi:F-type H+-transporting ATPase subunit b